MDKRKLLITAAIILLVSFTFGCVSDSQPINKTSGQDQTQEKFSEDDNLEPALQEIEELEGL